MTQDTVPFSVSVSTSGEEIRKVHRSGRPIVLPIFVTVGSTVFPNAEWSDFAVVVLSWWANGMTELVREPRHTSMLGFMDGPYELEVSSSSEDVWSIQGVTRATETRKKQFLGLVKGMPTVERFLQTTASILDALSAAEAWDSDCDALEIATRSLEISVNGRIE